MTPRPLRVGRRESARACLPARRHEPRPALSPARRAPRRSLPRRRARSARARRLDLGAAVEPRAARCRCARRGTGGPLRLARSLLRRPCSPTRRQLRPRIGSSGSFCSIPRSAFPRTSVWRPRRTPDVIGRTSPSRRGSTGATRRACSQLRRASSSRPSCGSTCSRRRGPLALPVLPERGGRRVRGDDAEQPAFTRVRIPTLLLLGETSYLPYDALLDDHAAALGDLLEVVRIPAGHTVLWDALADTVGVIERFLV